MQKKEPNKELGGFRKVLEKDMGVYGHVMEGKGIRVGMEG